ncbi:hypothetical protein K1719_016035 [Acacia pycnantha]|nr:hypothetical protein K1719_016035 [Acacia pycnantha]
MLRGILTTIFVEVTSSQLARLPGVISVKPDPDFGSPEKDYRSSNGHGDNFSKLKTGATLLFLWEFKVLACSNG